MRNMFEPGGIASYIRRISAALRQAGHEVLFFDRAAPGETRAPSQESVHFTSDDHDLIQQAHEHGADVLHLHMAIDAEAIAGAGPEAAQPRLIRTVHTHSPYCPSQGRFLKRSGLPCDRSYSLLGCLWGHAVDRCGSVRPAAIARNFRTVRQELAGLRQIPVILISEFSRQQMLRAGYAPEHLHVLHLPAPESREYIEPPREGPPVIAFLGRMIPHKGVDWLLRAMRHVRSEARLELAGTGTQEQQYRDLAQQLGLSHRVAFHGWLGSDAVRELLLRARGLVFPSLWHEPGGLVAYEAMTAGRATILSRVGDLPEIGQEGKLALMVKAGDETGLAKAIDRLAQDYDLARTLGLAGREEIQARYTLAHHMEGLMRLYTGL